MFQDDGTDRVHVIGARNATGFVLQVGSEAFEESGRSRVRGTLDYLQGLKVGVLVLVAHLPIYSSPFSLSPYKTKRKIEALSCLFVN